MPSSFHIATLTPGLLQPSAAIATHRAGGLGILDFEFISDVQAAERAAKRLNDILRASFGVKLNADSSDLLSRILASPPEFLNTVIFCCNQPLKFREHATALREKGITAILESTGLDHAREGVAAGFSCLIAKGHEAGGRVADETTFILLQRFQAELKTPIWVHGGIGLHTAAACAAGGAAGLILDAQLALARESPLPDSIKARIATMDGSESICIGDQLGESYRVYYRPDIAVVKDLQKIEARLLHDNRPSDQILGDWREAIRQRAGWESDKNALMLGQDAAFAAPLANRYQTVGGIVQAMREAIRTHVQSAEKLQPLAEGSPLARSHGTRYPIMQGPMTRVSDVPDFAANVAEGGALPFLALALMRGAEVKTLLEQARRRMGALPWGVGVLGFVPQELRQEQMDVISEYRPPFALIAGGRPDQASALEKQGIVTYLHVPSPGLLEMFVRQGARRFVFEGRECGGHVGPRTSFVLWNQMIDVLLGLPELDLKPEDFHVVFAAGIHDALSAAMVSVLAAPLAERGVQIGVLLGSSYLFTKEAVLSGAILGTFQEQARQCTQTVLLETGPGHSTRCVSTPFASHFFKEKRRLSASGLAAEEVRMTLEDLNLGRLRIASKGLTRNSAFGQDPTAPKLLEISTHEQVSQGMYMIGQVAALRNEICSVEELHRDVAIEGSKKLEGLTQRFSTAPASRKETPSDVAVIGMSCLLPKAPDLQTYWTNILSKVDAITEVPKERWDPELYYDRDPKAKDKIYSKWGGFLDDTAFDPMQYGMPPSTLPSIEPAQLLTLEVVRKALEDSGYLNRQFARDRTSVILGAGGGAADLGLAYGARSFIPNLENLPEFRGRSQEILEQMGAKLPEWTEDSFAGILTNVSAGRVANRFDLGGSNYTVDAACASSLAAVSLALKELEGHTSDMVIVGGIDTMQNPFTYLCFSKTHALSPRGRCRTFDESADGIAISEGIAVLVLKRLEDAERDGDRIYSVIKGVGSSSDGKDRGLTAPRPEGQASALRRAYSKAGFSPASVGLVEAHGTGTVAGDGAEVQALTKVFSEFGAERQGCAIGSVKSMIGHTKCSAGAAGLIKAALALHHKVLPPTLGVETPNPRARFPESPFFVNSETRPWLENQSGAPRRAGVSAFGFGGTNFHVVMEEYTGDEFSAKKDPHQNWSDELFLWAADSRPELLGKVESWREALAAQGIEPALRDLAYTAWKQVREKPAKAEAAESVPAFHLAIVASSLDDLRQKLTLALESLAPTKPSRSGELRGIYFSEQPLASTGKLAFLFPGQGSQYPHMLQDLLIHFPEMRQVFEQAGMVLAGKLEHPLSAYIFPPPSFQKDEEHARRQALTQTNVAQPALGAAGLAMFTLLREFGVRPDMVAGHSYGEYVALAASGVFDASTLIALSEARGRFIVESAGSEPGTMAAIGTSVESVSASLKNVDGVCIANVNAPRQIVISGTRAGVEQVVREFTQQGTAAQLIPVACAFHSPLVAGAKKRLEQFLSEVPLAEPSTPVYSNTTASPYPQEQAKVAALLVEHLVQPVEFVREIQAMYNAGARIFLEVGPRSVLTGLVERTLEDSPKLAVASNQSGKPGLTQLLHLLGQLAAHGVPVTFDRLYRDRSVQALNLKALPKSGKPLAASTWLVNGARAKPLKQDAQRAARPAVAKAPVNGSVTNGFPQQTASHHAAPPPATPPPALSQAAVAPKTLLPALDATASLEGVPQVMAQFQQMMARFLEVQQNIMLTYLAAESGAVSGQVVKDLATVVPAVEQQRQVPTQTAPVEVPSVKEPVISVSLPAAPSLDMAEITARLLAIVSERTGYPSEMLDLNLDLEADLGIDSIKRVEILGTFQQSFSAAGFNLGEGILEKLNGVRTLHGIVSRVSEQLQGEPVAQPEPQASAVESRSTEPVPPAVDNLSDDEVTQRLIAIVSERTGYPAEMLGLDLDLEADLGVDSIKRVEILGTFQQSFAASGIGLREGLLEQLSGVRTLRGIIAQVQEPGKRDAAVETIAPVKTTTQASLPNPEAIEEPVEDPSDDERIGRFTLLPVETPLAGQSKSLAKGRTILITDDGNGLAPALAAALRTNEYSVAIVRQGDSVREVESGHYEADLTSPEQVANLIALVNRRQGLLGSLIHLLPLGAKDSFTALDHEGWRARLRLGTKSLFYLSKSARNQFQDAAKLGGACVLAVTGMGGTFLSDYRMDAAAFHPDQGGVVGLTKTLALEWPEIRVKAVDVNTEEDLSAIASHLIDELTSTDQLVEIGYDGARRVILQPTLSPAQTNSPSGITIDKSSVILITGGARGIASRAAYHYAELYQPTLILAGRSPLPSPDEAPETAWIDSPRELKAALMERMRSLGEPVTPARVEQAYARLTAEREIRGNLAALKQLGAQVHYYSVDVRDAVAFGSLLHDLYLSFGRVDGVIHAAGVIEDKLVQDKTAESFERVFDTKVDSAFTLSRTLRPDSLKFLIFFSSVSGRFGNRGQGDYAAANEVLNKLAVCLDREWPARVTAINWGPWDSGGMVSPEVRKQFAERGVEMICPTVGLLRLDEELKYGRKGEAEVVIGGAGWLPAKQSITPRNSWPLLRQPLAAGEGDSLECLREIHPSYDLYLQDHQIDGNPVLPLAVATELMAEVAAQGWPELRVAGLKDLRLLNGIVLTKGPETVRIVAKPQGSRTGGILNVLVEIMQAAKPSRVHYRAVVELAEHLPQISPLEPPPLLDGRVFSMTVAEVYRKWLFHGPLLQGIVRVDSVGVSGIQAVLAVSQPKDLISGAPQGRWLFDPLLFDSALQLLVVWGREHWDMTALPSGFLRFRRFADPSGSNVICEMRLRPNTGGQNIHADVFFKDSATNQIIGLLEDMQGACSKALNRLAGGEALATVGSSS